MRAIAPLRAVLAAAFLFCVPLAGISQITSSIPAHASPETAYLGFDTNQYPGEANLSALQATFSFVGYWLNNPPGAKSDSWLGKRVLVRDHGFGFLVLFNGRLERDLKNPPSAATLGSKDARAAADAAHREGFHLGTIIFLDQEEGGRMEPDQISYILAWIDGVIAAGFRAGIYCSGIPAAEGQGKFIVTASNIRDHAGRRDVTFFIYNDACPPSPGCAYDSAAQPSRGGVPFSAVWQFAQSPRGEFSRTCSGYSRDGKCYGPMAGLFLDIDSATSADPSAGRR